MKAWFGAAMALFAALTAGLVLGIHVDGWWFTLAVVAGLALPVWSVLPLTAFGEKFFYRSPRMRRQRPGTAGT